MKDQENSHLIPVVPVALDASGVEMDPGRLIREPEGEG
jgi:hypothetical protein